MGVLCSFVLQVLKNMPRLVCVTHQRLLCLVNAQKHLSFGRSKAMSACLDGACSQNKFKGSYTTCGLIPNLAQGEHLFDEFQMKVASGLRGYKPTTLVIAVRFHLTSSCIFPSSFEHPRCLT